MLATVAALLLPIPSQAATSPAAGQYVPVAPATVVNNVSLAAGGTTTVTVTNANGIPSLENVSAVALNVIAKQPAAAGYLQVYPAGPRPAGSSTLNYQQGRTTANFEVVPILTTGQISIYSTAATKVVVRLRGYYTSAKSTVTGGSYVPVPPARVVNNVSLVAGGTTTVTVTGANGIPASPNVKAVALHVIAKQPAASGYLQVYPAGPRPAGNSTLNYQQGRTTANFETVPVSAGGQISIYSSAAVTVVVRLRGYYAISPYTATGGTFTPVAPATVVSNVSLAAGGTATVTVTDANGIPAAGNLSAVALNVIAKQPAAGGYLQVYPAGSRPAGDSTVNYQQGRTTAVFEAVPVSIGGKISIYSSAATKVVVRLRGYFTNVETPLGADWSQYRDGPARPGSNALETVLDPSTVHGLGQAWTKTISGTASEPAVVGGVVYAGSSDHKVYALKAATGGVIWTTATGGEVRSSPAVVGGVVYAGSSDHKVYALKAATGGVIWTTATGGEVSSSPAVTGGVVYVGSSDHKVYALNAATGAVIWTATTGGAVLDPPAAVGGGVYVRSRDGKAYALDAATGATVWVTTIGGVPDFGFPPSLSAPAVAGGMVYVSGPYNGILYALDAANGAVVWTATGGFTITGSPAVAEGIVYAVLGTSFGSNALRAMDAATGATIWQVPGGLITSVSSTSPVVANGVVYTGTYLGELVAYNAATGAYLWADSNTINRSTLSYISLAVANGAVYARRDSAVSAHHP